MQSKIIPLAVAVATVFSVPTANAAIDDAGMRYVSASEGFGGSLRVKVLNDTNKKDVGVHSTLGDTRLWVQGDVDLGGGFGSMYYWEWRTGDDKEVKTDSVHAGLTGPFGEIRAGIVEPAASAMIPPPDVMSDVGVSDQKMFGTSPNVIRWESPDINGLEFGTAVQMVDREGDDETIDKFDMAVSYRLPQGLWLGAGYESMNSGKNQDSSGIRIGAQYGQDNWLIAYNYRNYENFLPEGPSEELQNYNYTAALVDQAVKAAVAAAPTGTTLQTLTDAQLDAIKGTLYDVAAQIKSEETKVGSEEYESRFATKILEEFGELRQEDDVVELLKGIPNDYIVAFENILDSDDLDFSEKDSLKVFEQQKAEFTEQLKDSEEDLKELGVYKRNSEGLFDQFATGTAINALGLTTEESVAAYRIVSTHSAAGIDLTTLSNDLEYNRLSRESKGKNDRELAYSTAFSDESKYYKDAEYSAHSMSGRVMVDNFTFAAGYQIAETEYHKLIGKSEVETVALDVAYRLGSNAQIIAAHTNSSPKRGASESQTYLLYRVDF